MVQELAFEKLPAFRWRGMDLPVTSIKFTLRHDLVEHKYPGRDGANVEPTGMAPLGISARIPFLQGIKPGKNEKWGELYPNLFREFLRQMANREVGYLTHPELGNILCQPVSAETEWNAQAAMNGVFVEASWVENYAPTEWTEDGDSFRRVASDDSEVLATMVNSGILPQDLDSSFDLADPFRLVASYVNTPSILAYGVVGKIGQVQYGAERVIAAATLSNNPLAAHAVNAAERLWSDAQAMKQDIARLNKTIHFYTVTSECTMGGLLPRIPGARLDDLMKLNPTLVANPFIEAGTVVRYYE